MQRCVIILTVCKLSSYWNELFNYNLQAGVCCEECCKEHCHQVLVQLFNSAKSPRGRSTKCDLFTPSRTHAPHTTKDLTSLRWLTFHQWRRGRQRYFLSPSQTVFFSFTARLHFLKLTTTHSIIPISPALSFCLPSSMQLSPSTNSLLLQHFHKAFSQSFCFHIHFLLGPRLNVCVCETKQLCISEAC